MSGSLEGTITRLAPTRSDVVDGVSLVLLIGVALAGFHSVYGGWSFLVVGLVAAVFGVLTAHSCDRLRLPALPSMVIGLAVLLVTGAAVAMRDHLIVGLIPTGGAFPGFVDGLVSGWKRMLTTLPPSGSIGNLLAIVYLCGFVPAWLTTLLARREKHAATLLVLPATVLALSVLFGTRQPVSVFVQGAIAAVLAIAWLAARRARAQTYFVSAHGYRRAAAGAIMLGVTAFVGMHLGPSLPMVSAADRYVLREKSDPPFDPRQYGSPLNGFQRYLVGEWKDEVLFTVDQLPEPDEGDRSVYLRLAVLDDYDGVVWRVSPGSKTQGGRFRRVGEMVPVDVVGDEQTVDITIGELHGVWQPTFGVASGVEWLSNSDRADQQRDLFRLSTVTSTGVVPVAGGWQPGDHYRLSYISPTVLSDQDVTGKPFDRQAIVDVSSAIPEELRTLASALTKGKASPLEQAKKLEQFFRDGYYASGDDEIDEANAPGHSYGRLIKFVENETPIGNAEQYAAAMAIMARSLGLPARVVMGFRVEPTATEIRGEDVHAWVEIGFENGWKRFEPTSERRDTPEITVKKPKAVFESQDLPPPPVIPPEPEVNARQGEQAKRKDVRDEEDDGAEDDSAGAPLWKTATKFGAGLAIGGFAVFAGSVTTLKRRRRQRRRYAAAASSRVAGGWEEFLDTARDIGVPVPLIATRREKALLIHGGAGLMLASRADQAVFDLEDPTDDEIESYWVDVETVRTKIREPLSPWRRFTSALSTTSLRNQR